MKWKCKRKLAVWAVLTVAWMVVIFLFSAQNADDSSDTSGKVLSFLCGLFGYTPSDAMKDTLSFLVRKAAHMTEFGILGVLWLNLLREGLGQFRYRYAVAFAVASAYAVTDEFHQLFIDGRAGQAVDWLIDSTGIVLWLTAAWCIMKITERNLSDKNNVS